MRLQVVVAGIFQHGGHRAVAAAPRELELRLRQIPELHEVDGDLLVRLVVEGVEHPGLSAEGVGAIQRAVLLRESRRDGDEHHVRRDRLRLVGHFARLAAGASD